MSNCWKLPEGSNGLVCCQMFAFFWIQGKTWPLARFCQRPENLSHFIDFHACSSIFISFHQFSSIFINFHQSSSVFINLQTRSVSVCFVCEWFHATCWLIQLNSTLKCVTVLKHMLNNVEQCLNCCLVGWAMNKRSAYCIAIVCFPIFHFIPLAIFLSLPAWGLSRPWNLVLLGASDSVKSFLVGVGSALKWISTGRSHTVINSIINLDGIGTCSFNARLLEWTCAFCIVVGHHSSSVSSCSSTVTVLINSFKNAWWQICFV